MAFDPSTARLLDDSKPSGKFDPSTATLMPEPEASSLTRRLVGDTAVTALKSAIAVPEAAVGLADIVTGGRAGKAVQDLGVDFKRAKDIASEWYSPEQQQANRNLQNAQGFVGTLQAAAENPSAVAHTIGESIAPMFAGGAVARSAGLISKLSPLARGAIGEGVVSAGMQAEQTRQGTDDGLLTPQQSVASAGAGATTGLISRLSGGLAKKMGIEDVDTLLAGGTTTAGKVGMAKRVGQGLLTEGVLEEMPQSAQEQVWQNYAEGRPLMEGVPEASALGLVTGGIMGGGINALRTGSEQPPVDPNAGPLSRAAATAQQTGAAQAEQARQAAQQADTAATAPAAGEARQGAANAAQAGLSAEAFRQQPDVPPAGSFSGMNEFADFIAQERADLEQRRNPPPFEEMKGVDAGFDPMSRARNQVPPASGSFGAMNEFADLLGQEQADVQQRRDGIAQTQGLQRDSRLESIGNEIDANRQQQTAQARLSLLDQLDADPETVNLLPRFESMLKKQGYAQRRATPEERELIARRMDARAALVNADQEPVAPNELDAAAMGIRERQPKVRQPQPAPAEKPQRAAFPMTQTGAQRQAAERTQATGQAFEVVPHPTVKGRFAVQAVADQFRDATKMVEPVAAANTSPERVTETPEIEQVAQEDDPFEAILRESRQKKAAVRTDIGDVSNGAVVADKTGNRFAMVLPDVDGGGKWRIQQFDNRGFVGHSVYNSQDEALNEAIDRGFVKRDDTALDRLQSTPEFVRGNFITELVGKVNAREITSDEFDRRISEYDAKQGTANEKAPEALPQQAQRGTAQQAEVTNAAGSEQAVSDIAAARSPVGADSAVTGSAGVHADSGRGRPQGTPEGGAQEPGQGVGDDLRTKLQAVERDILAAAPPKFSVGGGDIEGAMRSLKVPRALKEQRKAIKEQMRTAQVPRSDLDTVAERVTEPTHADPGQAPEAATAPVIAASLKKSARNTPLDVKQAKATLLADIDRQIADAPTLADKGARYAKDGRIERANGGAFIDFEKSIGFVTLDVPGDGSFKVLNTKETLQRFRDKAERSPGFRDNPTTGMKLDPRPAGPTKKEQSDAITKAAKEGRRSEALDDLGNAIEIARLHGANDDPLMERFREIADKDYDAWRAEQDAEGEIAARDAENLSRDDFIRETRVTREGDTAFVVPRFARGPLARMETQAFPAGLDGKGLTDSEIAGRVWDKLYGQSATPNSPEPRAEQGQQADTGADKIKRSFAGESARTADTHALATAQSRIAAGEDAEVVRQETGWHKAADGRWRFEIDDSDATILPAMQSLGRGGYDAREIASVTYRKRDDGTYDLTLNPPSPKETSDFVTLTAIRPEVMRAVLPDAAARAVERNAGVEDFIGNLEEAKRIDAAFTFDGFNALPLDQVIDHPALFAAYPALREVMVQVDPKLGVGGAFSLVESADGTTTQVIRIGKGQQLSTLLHEIQHGIQDIEGFASGGTARAMMPEDSKEILARRQEILDRITAAPDDADVSALWDELDAAGENPVITAEDRYRRLAGETESRNTQARQKLTAAERRATSPESTADVKASDVIVVFNGTEMASAPAPANAAPMEAIGTTPDAIWSAVESLVGPLRRRRIIVVQSADVLVEQGILQSRDANGAQAFVKDGKAYFIAGNIQPGNERAVFLHEVGAHLGMERILSPLQRSVLLNRIKTWAAQANGSIESRIAQAALRRVEAAGVAESEQSSEVIAYFVEEAVKADINPTTDTTGPIGQWFKTLWSALRTALEKLGLINASKLTAQDVVNLAHGAANVAMGEEVQSSDPRIQFSRAAMPDWLNQMPQATQEAARKAGIWQPHKPLKERLKDIRATALKRVQQGLVDQFAPLKELGDREYVLARLTKSSDAPLEALLLYGKPFLNDAGAIDVNLEKGGLIGGLQKLEGEHDRFFAWMAGNRAEQLKAEGRENLFTDTDITALKDLNQGNMPDGSSRAAKYNAAKLQFSAYSKAVLDIAEKAGIIAAEDRAIWEKDFYVPFYRAMEDGEYKGPRNASGLVNQYAFKKLKGGTDNLNDLMQNTLRNWSHLLSASLKNQASAAALESAEAAGVATPISQKQKGSVSFLGRVKHKIPKGQSYVENGVTLVSDGTAEVETIGEKHYMVDDPFILNAITSLEFAGWNNPAMKMMQKAKHYLTLGVTISPTFKIRNLIRDQISAIGLNPMSYNLMSNLAQGWKGTDKDSAQYAKMLAGGGLMRFGTFLEDDRAEHMKRLIQAGVSPDTILDTKDKVKAMLGKAWDWWQDVGDRSENIARASIYQQRYDQFIKEGKTADEAHLLASFAARDSMDFSLQGQWGSIRFLTQLVPFLGARLQGLYKLGREGVAPSVRLLTGNAEMGDKERAMRFGAVAGTVALASMVLFLAYRDDDDWKEREEWDRDAYFWFKVGDTAFRIPKPFEIGAIGTIAERGLETALNGMDKESRRIFIARMWEMLMGTFAMNPVPQLFKPVIDLYANTDSFTGRPIETMGMERLSKAQRIGPGTSATAQLLGKATSLVGLSPVQVDHLIEGYFSWLGTHAVMTTDFALRPLMGLPDQPARKWPDGYFVLGDFAKDLPSNQSKYLTQFYEQSKKVQEAMADIRYYQSLGQTEKALELSQDNADKIRMHGLYTTAERQISGINKQIKAVQMSSATADVKREQIDRLTQARNQIAKAIESRRVAQQ